MRIVIVARLGNLVIGHLAWVKSAIVVVIIVIILIINITVIVILIAAIIAKAVVVATVVVIAANVLNLYRILVLGEEIISGTTYRGKSKHSKYNTNYQPC